MMSSNSKIRALEDIALQFHRIGKDLLSILHEDISEAQKVEAVNKYFKTLLFTSTITEASSFLSCNDKDDETQRFSAVKATQSTSLPFQWQSSCDDG